MSSSKRNWAFLDSEQTARSKHSCFLFNFAVTNIVITFLDNDQTVRSAAASDVVEAAYSAINERPTFAHTEASLRRIQAAIGAEILVLTHTLSLSLQQRTRLVTEFDNLTDRIDTLDMPELITAPNSSDDESDVEYVDDLLYGKK